MNIEVDRELARRLGSRHLGQETATLGAVNETNLRRVRVRSESPIATTASGQKALWFLTNLLARQFDIIHEVQVVVPEVPLLPGVALVGGEHLLQSTLESLVTQVAGAAVAVVHSEQWAEPADVEVCVGHCDVLGAARAHIGVIGSGWGAGIDDPRVLPIGLDTNIENPVGPFFAASLAAGEVFKRLLGVKSEYGHIIDRLYVSLWDFQAYEQWGHLPSGCWPQSIALPPHYLVGAGAVGQAFAAVLMAAPNVAGYITVIDSDKIDIDDGNGNRYVLATLGSDGEPKASYLCRLLHDHGIEALPYEGTWQEYVHSSNRPSTRTDVIDMELNYRYQLVLSCVDVADARRSIQALWPQVLIGASTLGFGLTVENYDMTSGFECLNCRAPRDEAALTVEGIAAELRQLPVQERAARLRAANLDTDAVETYLAQPQCGKAGETEVRKLIQVERGHDWAIGFVSAASGIILAVQILKHAITGNHGFPYDRGNALRFNFLNPEPKASWHRRRTECSCNTTGRQVYDELWGISAHE